LDTKRNGKAAGGPTRPNSAPVAPLQRFLCRACGRSFTTGRRTADARSQSADEVAREAVRLYVQGLPSYRTLATLLEARIGRTVSRFTLNRWVDTAGAAAKTPLMVSAGLAPPSWGGILGIDGKVIRVRGDKACLLIGVDHPSQDIVHALVLPKEDGVGFDRLVREAVVAAGYPLQGLVSDLGGGFLEAWRDGFARVPFQACRIHYDRHLDQYVPKLKRSAKAALHAEFKARLRAVVYADTYEHACRLWYPLSAERARFAGIGGRHDALAALESKFGLYTAHHRYPQLPADNNVAENVIKQLGKKLRLMEGFASLGSAERFCRLLIACYRFKRFTDSRRNGGNDRSPLEHAGVSLPTHDWLDYHLTATQQQQPI
jgi:transposase-like protein